MEIKVPPKEPTKRLPIPPTKKIRDTFFELGETVILEESSPREQKEEIATSGTATWTARYTMKTRWTYKQHWAEIHAERTRYFWRGVITASFLIQTKINPEKIRELLKEILVLNDIRGSGLLTTHIGMLFQDSFVQVEEPAWEPKEGDEVWKLDEEGKISKLDWIEASTWRQNIYNMGMIFQTEAKAEAFRTAYLAFVKSYREKV
jgi:hypothetical protein